MVLCVQRIGFGFDRMAEAEYLLTGSPDKKWKPDTMVDFVVTSFGDSAPFACQLLGKVNIQATRTKEAHEAYLRSLKLNPFLWDSFDSICQTGENINPETVFQVFVHLNFNQLGALPILTFAFVQTSHLDSFSMCHGTQTVVTLVGNQNQEPVVMGVCNLNSIDIQPKYVRYVRCTFKKPLRSIFTCLFCLTAFIQFNYSTPMIARPTLKSIPVHIPEETNVLLPSNKNRPLKSTRMLFTSTPMGGHNSTA